MPSCPECGFDVEEPGLCEECRKDWDRKSRKSTPSSSGFRTRITDNPSTEANRFGKGFRESETHPQKEPNPRTRQRIIMIVLLMLVAGEAGFILGREINRASAPAAGGSNAANPNPPYVSSVAEPEELTRNPSGGESEGASEADGSGTPSLPVAYDLDSRTLNPPLEDKEEFVRWTLANRLGEEEYFISWRWDCAQDLLSWDSIKDERILKAFLLAPREKFIREQNEHLAYEHRYLPIGYGATITDPWVVSIMTQTINPETHHRVLEIGTGSGYQASILAQLSNHVFTIEIIEELLAETDLVYRKMERAYPEYRNIIRKADDGYFGWEQYAPFDRIIVTCGIDHIPPDLLKQLAPDGVMVIPVGPPSGQTLMKVVKKVDADGTVYFDREKIMSVKFIPFVTKEGKTRQRGF